MDGNSALWERRPWAHVTAVLAAVMVVTTVFLPSWSAALGMVALFYVLRRQVGPLEALVGTFVFLTALASSRYGPHLATRAMRLPLLLLLAVPALKRFAGWTVPERRAHLRWLLVLLLVTSVPTFISQGFVIRDPQIVLLPFGWFLYGAFMFHLTEEERRQRFRLVAVLVPAVFLALFAFGVLRPGAAALGGRFRGFFGNPNEMSHWWLAASTMLVALSLRLRNRTLFYAVAAATVVLFLRSGSRSPLAGFLVVAAGTWFLSRETPRWLRGAAAVGAIAIAVALPALSLEQLSLILPDSVVRSETLEEGGGRFVAWRFGWEQLQERFWWGGGAGFEEVIYAQYSELLSALNHQGLSHNSYLAFALNFGVVGALVLAVGMWRKLGLTRPDMFFIGAVPFLVTTFFEGVLTSPLNATTPIWFLAASLVSQELAASSRTQG